MAAAAISAPNLGFTGVRGRLVADHRWDPALSIQCIINADIIQWIMKVNNWVYCMQTEGQAYHRNNGTRRFRRWHWSGSNNNQIKSRSNWRSDGKRNLQLLLVIRHPNRERSDLWHCSLLIITAGN
jgi:hypothetical protein